MSDILYEANNHQEKLFESNNFSIFALRLKKRYKLNIQHIFLTSLTI